LFLNVDGVITSVDADQVLKVGTILLLVIGAVWDIRTRRIPNLLTFGGAIVGGIANIAISHQDGLFNSVIGWGLGIALLFIPFIIGGIGGGDVKLLGAAGAWGGPLFVVHAAFYSALAGSVVSFGFLLYRRELGIAISPLIRSVRWSLALVLSGVTTEAQSVVLRPKGAATTVSPLKVYFPFGPALAIGGLAALFLR
jgi:prepilin peptidase CpaA